MKGCSILRVLCATSRDRNLWYSETVAIETGEGGERGGREGGKEREREGGGETKYNVNSINHCVTSKRYYDQILTTVSD